MRDAEIPRGPSASGGRCHKMSHVVFGGGRTGVECHHVVCSLRGRTATVRDQYAGGAEKPTGDTEVS